MRSSACLALTPITTLGSQLILSIDSPTLSTHTAGGELIDTMNVYVLSCGHQVVGFEKPDYCPKCGTRVDR